MRCSDIQSGWVDVEVEICVRKYPVDTERLSAILVEHKKAAGLSNSSIAEILGKPKTLVEHWFRQDKYFTVPDEDIWHRLKDILRLQTDEFDESVMTFENKGGQYDMRNRIYLGDISPTLTVTCGNTFYLVTR